MSDEPTKACVRVLRLEAKLRYVLWCPFNKLIGLFEFLSQYINWCIVRSCFRWFGILFTGLLIYSVVRVMSDNPHPDLYLINLVGAGMLITLVCGFFTLISWVGVPYDEQRVIDDHIKELGGEKK